CPEGWTYNGRNCYCDNFVLRRECPSGWHRIENNCYLLNRGTVNYQTATQTCTAFNSQVVSFDSEDEAIRVNVEYLHDSSVGSDRWSNAEVGAWIHDQITKCFGSRQPDETRSPGMFIHTAGLNSLDKSLTAETFGDLPIARNNYGGSGRHSTT
ncbi:unnamed protein product, partial [Anisakis simplex]|uniref:C-type lectin domain-containing protein n=1 Tax=Anisakis simplex TaxID=6269 RepID=A0A0M3JDX8_ANISI